MDSEERFWVSVVALVLGTISVLGLGGYALGAYHQRKMAALGFQEVQLRGTSTLTYQKVPSPKESK